MYFSDSIESRKPHTITLENKSEKEMQEYEKNDANKSSEELNSGIKKPNSTPFDFKNTLVAPVPMSLQQEFAKTINIPNVQIQKVWFKMT